jgi:hypothetical protein
MLGLGTEKTRLCPCFLMENYIKFQAILYSQVFMHVFAFDCAERCNLFVSLIHDSVIFSIHIFKRKKKNRKKEKRKPLEQAG